ncbi:MAG: hypothetical protein EOO72_15625 [Myxococcaceae bacterium]|nr:MAG: hypothetical protein EOO72_15625 [Myxococcaceae bacterium]
MPVEGLTGARGILARGKVSFALLPGNEVWMCGDNENGQLGTGTPYPVKVPMRMPY